MIENYPRFLRWLVAYYAAVQAAHILALFRGYSVMTQQGEITFLAQPPPGGWTLQAQHFLISLGAIDLLNALLSLIFVYMFFARSRGWFWTGTTTLTVSLATALVYAYGTLASGAWNGSAGEYLLLVILYLPVALLTIVFGNLGRKVWLIDSGQRGGMGE